MNIPDVVNCKNAMCELDSHIHDIDVLYNEIVDTLVKSCPKKKVSKKHNNVPGWNDYVKEWHDASRNSFLLWVDSKKPRSGPVYDIMRRCRARFKYALRHCKRYEETYRADALAKSMLEKNYDKFWKDVKSMNNSKVPLPKSIEGFTGEREIANLWMNCYKSLFNSNMRSKNLEKVYCSYTDHMCVTVEEIQSAIKQLSKNKAPGPDGLCAEHLMYASGQLHILLSMLISCMFVHGYMPDSLMNSILVPIVKDKCGLLTSKDNYRPIALANVISKLLEIIILTRIEEFIYTNENQFGFKRKSSTDQCIYTLKEMISMYNVLGSTVFCCFLDASKAFDRVNHVKLMCKLRNRGTPEYIVRLLAFWYSNQTICVRWGTCISDPFNVSNGVRQGGLLSPKLFNLYMDELSVKLNMKHTGLSYGSGMINNIMFADDLVLLSPSVKGLQDLINICHEYGNDFDIVYNEKKSVTMCINKTLCGIDPSFKLGDGLLKNVTEVKYLGHLITNSLLDEADMKRQLRSLYCRSNIVARKFYWCSSKVKCFLFKAYCGNMYCCSLWANASKKTTAKLKVAYNNSLRIILHYERRCSASNMFVSNRVACFDGIIRKTCYSLLSRVSCSINSQVKRVYEVVSHCKFSIAFKWWSILYTVAK